MRYCIIIVAKNLQTGSFGKENSAAVRFLLAILAADLTLETTHHL